MKHQFLYNGKSSTSYKKIGSTETGNEKRMKTP